MRILQINSVCGYGSTGRIVMELYTALGEQGHDCLIAFGRKKTPAGIHSIHIGSELSVNIHGILSRITDKHGFYSTRATKRLIAQIKEYDPDIIHLHNIHGYYINIKELFHYLSAADKPVFWTLHDCWAFTGHCSYFDYVGCDKWKTGCYDCQQKKAYPESWFLDNSKWNYEQKRSLFTSVRNMTIITPSKWLADLTRESFLSKCPVIVINNGIDLNQFKPAYGSFRKRYHLKDNVILLGVASVWDQRKGLKYLIGLSALLSEKYKIVIVGLTEKQKMQLPSDMVGITRTENADELAEIYTAADIFINPTLEETLGLVNIEALACGTPVITFNTGGSPECIDESCGFIVEKGNLEELAVTIHRLAENKPDANACISRSRKFDKNISNKKYIDAYNQCLMPAEEIR